VQVENENGVSEWEVLYPDESNLVPLGEKTKNFKIRITPQGGSVQGGSVQGGSEQVFEKTIEVSRLADATVLKSVLPVTGTDVASSPTDADNNSRNLTVLGVIAAILILLVSGDAIRKKFGKTDI